MSILTIKDCLDAAETQLGESNALREDGPIHIAQAATVNDYKRKHAMCDILILFAGDKFANVKGNSVIVQDRDIYIECIVIAPQLINSTPSSYVDFAINSLSGLDLDGERAENVYCQGSELISEEGGEWWYRVRFVFPIKFLQSDYQ